MRRPKRLLKKLGISILSLTVLLLATELILRSAGYADSPARYFDTDVGYRFHPNQTRTMYGKDRVVLARVAINELGLRGPAPRDEPVPGAKRVVCLGDSFTFGWAVADEDAYPALLADDIRREVGETAAEVLNFGMPGHNTENELAVYEYLARPSAPDIVILGFYLNDLEPPFAAVPNTDSWLYRALGRTALLELFREVVGPRSRLFRTRQTPEDKAYVRAFNENRTAIYLDPRSELAAPYLGACLDALGRLIESVQADGAELMIVAFPGRLQVDPIRKAKLEGRDVTPLVADFCGVQAEVARVASERGIPYLDLLLPFVDSSVEPFGDVDRGHPSPTGNSLAAREILRALRAQGWL